MAEQLSSYQLGPEQGSSYQELECRIDQFDIDPNTPFTPLRIVVMGSGDFANDYVKGAIAAGHEVVTAIGPAKQKDKELDKVRQTAKDLNIPDYMFSSLSDPEMVRLLREEVKPDLIIGASLTAIIPQEVTDIPELGMWGWHPSRPLEDGYRGRSAINWQIINEVTDEDGDPAIGMCIYGLGRDNTQIVPKPPLERTKSLPIGSEENSPNDIADKGPILAEKLVKLPEDARTAAAAFPKVLAKEGVNYLLEATNKMAIAKDMGIIFRGQPQVVGEGNYQPPIEKKHAKIDLTKPAKTVKATVDGSSNNPGSWGYDKDGNMVSVYEASIVETQEAQEPGNLVDIVELEEGKGYVLLGTGEHLLRANTLRDGHMEGSKEIKGKLTPAHQYAREKGWEVGTVVLK